jgi:glutathione-regulated potassium-efflux system ancillary protein KefG
MSRILVLFAHPVLEKSRVQYSLLKAITGLDNITINDLYQNYPEFDIDVKQEKKLLLAHDIIIWQHPFYWYSSPALLKQWQDLVLEHGWAYGKNGTALTGKRIFNVLTSGGSTKAYKNGG